MKRILVLICALLSGLCSFANSINWHWPGMVPATLNTSTYTNICRPDSAHIAVVLDYYLAGSGINEWRAWVEIGNASFGYSSEDVSGWVFLGSAPGSVTKVINIPVTHYKNFNIANVRIEKRVYIPTSGSFGPWYEEVTLFCTNPGPKVSFTDLLTNVDFNVRGKKQTGNDPPPEIINCNNSEIRIDGLSGSFSSYSTTIERGALDGLGKFYPTDEGSRPFIVTSAPGWLSFHAFLSSSGLPYWPVFYIAPPISYVRVRVTVTGPCPPYTYTRDMVFKLISVNAFVNFSLMGTDGNALALNQTLPIPDIGVQPSMGGAAPPSSVVPGWMGAWTAGIWGASTGTPLLYGGATGVSHNIRVERVNSTTGTPLGGPIVDFTDAGASIAGIKNLNSISMPGGFFYKNYATIAPYANDFTFKVTTTVLTEECGAISNYSYFKIVEGMPGGGGEYWKATRKPDIMLENTIITYPNPAAKVVTFDLGKAGNTTTGVSILVSDMMGRKVITEQALPVSNQKASLDIGHLPAGLYLYKVRVNDKDYQGKIEKQ